MNSIMLPALCQKCGKTGPYPLGDAPDRVAWCTCKIQGPFVAPPGHITRFTVRTKEEAAFAERCRLASNAERRARDDLAAIWVGYRRRGKYQVRKLPETHPKRVKLERAYDAALAAIEALQAECSHPGRCFFNRDFCDVCDLYLGEEATGT